MTLVSDILPKLRPWQKIPVQSLSESLRRYRGVLDASDTGTGKTFVACAIAKLLEVPTLVVCPKIAQTAWRDAAAHFNDSVSVINYEKLRMGTTPFGHWTHQPDPRAAASIELHCESCHCEVNPNIPFLCHCHKNGVHCVTAKRAPRNLGPFRYTPFVSFLIFDEVHRCSGRNSQNAELLIGAKRENKLILGLSATPAVSPLQMRALGYLLGLHTLTDRGGLGYYEWLRTVGCGRLPGVPGYRWVVGAERQAEVMRRIHSHIFPARGVRVRTSEIPNFPSRTIISECYDIENPQSVDKTYSEISEALQRTATKAESDADPEHPLTKLLRARQRLELLKIPIAVELCEDYISKGCSVAIFCNFSETIDALSRILNTQCIIDGRDTHNRGDTRARRVSAFQANAERIILLNNKAGGIAIGLQDCTGEYPRVGLVFPDFSADVMRQVFGRLPRDGGKTHSIYRVLFAAGTVEAGVARALRAKSNNLDTLTDADMQPDNFRLTKPQ